MSGRSIEQKKVDLKRITSLRGCARGVCAVLATVTVSLALAASASAAPGAAWELTSRSYPTDLPPGGTGMVEIDVYNTGAGASTGNVTVTDTLPPGLKAIKSGALTFVGFIGGEEEIEEEEEFEEEEASHEEFTGMRTWNCSGSTVVACTTRPGFKHVLRPLNPGSMQRLGIKVEVASGAEGTVANQVSAAGGGAAGPAAVSSPLTVGSAATPFGLAGFDGWFTSADGTTDTQAGSHPHEAIFSFDLNEAKGAPAGGRLRDVTAQLPPGLVGDPHAVPQCTRQQFLSGLEGGCPASTQIGVDRTGLPAPGFAPLLFRFPVYNLVPPPGVPAEFGFTAEGTNILLDAVVRSGGDYGITEHVRDIGYGPVYNSLTVWGVPGEENHNPQRCGQVSGIQRCGLPSGSSVLKPFLTVPTSCEGPLTTRLSVDDWKNPTTAEASYISHDLTGMPTGYSGCEHLGFSPSISVAPDTTYADTPAGLTVDLKVAQEGLDNPEGLAASNIKDTTVTLPEGMVINPGQAAGLAACQASQDGLTTEAEKAEGKENNGPPSCPNASQVGTVEIETPLLSKPLKGDVYVLQSNPPHLKLLLTASGEGVNLKLVGNVELNEQTGRLTSTFSETPELPFTDFKLSFSGGAQAALSTPVRCGLYSTSSDFTPWSTPIVEDVFPTTSFLIEQGPGGSACTSPLGFNPAMIAGSSTDQAGGYTDFSLLLQRADDQQRVSSLQFKAPKGLLGMISKVPLCPEPQAAQGTCSAESQIGHTVVEAGPGPYPLVVPQPGQPPAPIYLTGGYKGAPYGLSIVVPLVVGPFTLQTQVVRAKIEVDQHTAQITVTTDPLPQIIDGVPADLRTINAVIDRPGFMFNPTNCSAQSFSGTATSNEAVTASISSPFQMGSCQTLKFKPGFKVSTSGHTSRANGASLDAKVLYPTVPPGNNQASSQSNIASVKVDLPKQLPSRLTTLQKACLAATFEANPAACPADSKVGEATAVTPVLPVKLTGPAYFVSHGGEAFPSLIVVLQGYGVTVDLVGTTFINSKTNITSSTFKQVPDVPIYSFDLNLPEGKFSALAATGNLCKSKLKMPTVFTAQDGAVIHQSTPIAVTGCTKQKAKAKKTKKNRKAKKAKQGSRG